VAHQLVHPGQVDGHALDLLPEMVQYYASAVDAKLVSGSPVEYAGYSEP